MEKREYLVGVTVIEARKLAGKDASGTSDPYVKITCANKDPQVTQKKFQTNAVVWNQSFTFPSVQLNRYELETFELIFEVYDYNAVFSNVLIGQHSIGLSTLYRSLNHEFNRVWLTLFNPDLQNNHEIQGYLQVSCFIVGPNERPPAHSNDEDRIEDEEEGIDEERMQGLSEEQKLAIMKKKQGLFLLQEPGIVRKGYQLSVNVLKAEKLPSCDSSGTCNSFVSVRTSGFVQATRVNENNVNPTYNSRLCFPVYTPIYNDKIVIRLWSQNRRSADTFIANVPEYPSQFDFFNISKLLVSEGKMRATWINLYGIHPDDRPLASKSGTKQSSAYLGRILISMQLLPHEQPQMYPALANPQKEPEQDNFKLWVDVYDLVNCDEAKGRNLYIVASIGGQKSQQIYAKYKKQSDSYTWTKISLESLKGNFPTDLRQTPDIFIDIMVDNTFSKSERIGYLRVSAKECVRQNSQPQWHRLKSPYNDKLCPGIILINLQYVPESTQDRFPKQRGIEVPYRFYGQIFSGFEIAPNLDSNSLKTFVDLRIGASQVTKDGKRLDLQTQIVEGRHPSWDQNFEADIYLDKNLQFASDMRVMLFSQSTIRLINIQQKEFIGEFLVPIRSLTKKLYKKPQYFNVIGNDGNLQGQILARFFLQEINQKNKGEDQVVKIRRELQAIKEDFFKADIEVSVYGIRELINQAKNPIIKINLTRNLIENQIIQKNDINSRNPNIGETIKFKQIVLPLDPLLWPLMVIQISDQSTLVGGCESCYTTIPLFEYAQDILTQQQILFTKAQFNKNQNRLKLVQPQINPQRYYQSYLKQISRPPASELIDKDDSQLVLTESEADYEISLAFNQVAGIRMKEIENDIDLFPYLNDESDTLSDREQLNNNHILGSEESKTPIKLNDLQLKIKRRQTRFAQDDYQTENEENNLPKRIINAPENNPSSLGMIQKNIEGAIIDQENVIEIVCTASHKREEEALRKQKIEDLEGEIDQINLIIQGGSKKRDELKNKLIDLKDKIQYLKDEEMNENKFWGYVLDSNAEDPLKGEFAYGREIVKDGQYDQKLQLPYGEFPLFSQAVGSSVSRTTTQVGYIIAIVNKFYRGILRSGLLTGATLKVHIKVLESVDNNENDIEDQDDMKRNQIEDEQNLSPGSPDINDVENNGENKETIALKKIQEKYPFDIAQQPFLQFLLNQRQSFKVRVYLLTGQNLSATDSSTDMKTWLAGYRALCSANSYPVLIVGNGKNEQFNHKIKYISDREKFVPQDLNPKYYRSYEFDAFFPEDWRLEVQIYDKGRISYTDALIGSTVIDIENRLFGNHRKQILDGLMIYKEQINRKIKDEQRMEKPDQQILNFYRKNLDEINKNIQIIQNTIPEKPVPVEFRELRHPQKKQAQGMLEMWVEVLTQEEARRIPMSKLQIQSKEEYEIRLIIWETRDVPLNNGGSVDIYIKVQFDPTGWAGTFLEKITDRHYGSKDGRGVFNYRFKFDVSTPCEFPRLKFQLYDFGMISDDSIGEAILNLKKTLTLLSKEGRIDIPKTWLQFSSSTDKLNDCGQILISMQIIPKQEADLSPVGEGWDEPNENPKLEKPSEGRGMGNKILSVANIDVSKLQVPQVNFFRNFIIIGVIFGMVVVVLIVIMFLK